MQYFFFACLFVCFLLLCQGKRKIKEPVNWHTVDKETVSIHSYVFIVYLVYFVSILLEKWICCKVSLFLFTATLVHRKHNLMFLIKGFLQKIATSFQGLFKEHIKFSRTNYRNVPGIVRNGISQMVHECAFPVWVKRILSHQVFAPSPSLHFSVLGQCKRALKEHFRDIICQRSQRNMELEIKLHVVCVLLLVGHTTAGESVFDWLFNWITLLLNLSL